MTASPTCRSCGVELAPHRRRCVHCSTPVRQLTPRRPRPSAIRSAQPVGSVPDGRERSRSTAGVRTLGLVERASITVVVLLLAPWTLAPVALFFLWPCWLVAAFYVLRAAWRGYEAQRRARASTAAAWGLLLVMGLALPVAWMAAGQVGHAVVGVAASLAAIVLAGRWLLKP